MPSVNNAGIFCWGSGCGSSPGGQLEVRWLLTSTRAVPWLEEGE